MFNIYTFKIDFNIEVSGKPFYAKFPFFANGNPVKGLTCGISSVYAGDMKLERENPNRQKLFKTLNLDAAKVYGLNQIHSQTVLVVDSNHPPVIEADGMVTNDKDITLSVTVADCLPVYLFDKATASFGIVHSG
jgi:copper oxidase (laccase) domain-containing protein